MSEPFHHRPTLKQVGTGSEIMQLWFLWPSSFQTNKPFKSRHATKASLKERSKGKISNVCARIRTCMRLSKVARMCIRSRRFVSLLGRVSRQAATLLRTSSASAQSKINRRNHAKQIQLQKRQSLLSAVRIFGGVDGAPRIVAVVPLCEDVTSRAAASALVQSLEIPTQTDDECVWKVKFVKPIFAFCASSLSLFCFSEGWNGLKRPYSLFNWLTETYMPLWMPAK